MGEKRKRSLKKRTHRKHRKQRKYVAIYRKTTKRQKRRKTRKRLKGGGDSDSDSHSHSDSDPGPLPPPSDHPDHSLPRTLSRDIPGPLSLPLNKKLYFKGTATVQEHVTNKLGFSTVKERVANVKFRFVNITHIEHTTETYTDPRSGLQRYTSFCPKVFTSGFEMLTEESETSQQLANRLISPASPNPHTPYNLTLGTYGKCDTYSIERGSDNQLIVRCRQTPVSDETIITITDTTSRLIDAQVYGYLHPLNNSNIRGTLNTYLTYPESVGYGHISFWDVSEVTDMNHLFANARRFNEDISAWDVSKVTNMSYMFFNAQRFNGDISDWDVSKVTDMSYMFANAVSFGAHPIGVVTQVINTHQVTDTPSRSAYTAWDVSKVTNMSYMFFNAQRFNGDISEWNVSEVTDMSYMFANAVSFGAHPNDVVAQDINTHQVTDTASRGACTAWDVSKVTNMSNMFANARKFNKDISKWDVSNVTNMSNMFAQAFFFNQDISKWDVSKVTNMCRMFAQAYSIGTPLNRFRDEYHPDISGWDVQHVIDMREVFDESGYVIRTGKHDLTHALHSIKTDPKWKHWFFVKVNVRGNGWKEDFECELDLSLEDLKERVKQAMIAWANSRKACVVCGPGGRDALLTRINVAGLEVELIPYLPGNTFQTNDTFRSYRGRGGLMVFQAIQNQVNNPVIAADNQAIAAEAAERRRNEEIRRRRREVRERMVANTEAVRQAERQAEMEEAAIKRQWSDGVE